MKKIICLLICIFTIICCFGCSPSNTIRLKYEIEGNSICFMTPNNESLYSFFGIDRNEAYSFSRIYVFFNEDSEGKNTVLGSYIELGDYFDNFEKSYFIIETVFGDFSETLINNALKRSKFITVFFQQASQFDSWKYQVDEYTNRTIFDNQPLKLIKA